jgi:antirestriction protein ArdC
MNQLSSRELAFKVVMDKIIAEMDKGIVPWRRTWTAAVPQNAVSHKMYRGINLFLLSMSDYADPRWLSFKQAIELKGTIRKGEHSTPVVFWNLTTKIDAETGKEKKVGFLKYYSVFNVEQCDDLKIKPLSEIANEDIRTGEDIVNGFKDKPVIKFCGSQPCYIPSKDIVQIPKITSFDSSEEYYSVLFHELAHSTGHESRLNRTEVTQAINFGSVPYSKEELTAEFAASFLCHAGQIANDLKQTAAYITSWKKYIVDNPKELVYAAGRAQKAADYILGTTSAAITADEQAVPV